MKVTRFSPVAVTFSGGTLRAVQLERRRLGWAVREALALRPEPDVDGDAGDRAVRRLAEVWARRRFVGTDVVFALPNADLIRSLLEVDADKDDPLLAAAVETERVHGLSPGTYELTAWRPEQASGGRRSAVMVVGAAHDATRRWAERFSDVGLTATHVECRASAAASLLGLDGSDERGQVVLDIGHGSTELAVVRDGTVIYQRALPGLGIASPVAALADDGLDAELARHAIETAGLIGDAGANGLPYAPQVRRVLAAFVKDLVREAEPALDYAARLYAPQLIDTLTVLADGAAVPGLEGELAQRLSLEPLPVRCAQVQGLPGQAGYAVALGLCLSGSGGAGAFNLLPLDVIEQRETSRTVRFGLAGAASYAAALAVVGGVYIGVNRPQFAQAASTRIADAQAEHAGLMRQLEQVRQETQDAEHRLEATRVLSERPDWSTLLHVVAQSTGETVVLDDLRVSMVGESMGRSAKVLVRGAAEDPWSLSTFVLSLERIGLFDRVNILRSQRAPRSAVTVTEFELECLIGVAEEVSGG